MRNHASQIRVGESGLCGIPEGAAEMLGLRESELCFPPLELSQLKGFLTPHTLHRGNSK